MKRKLLSPFVHCLEISGDIKILVEKQDSCMFLWTDDKVVEPKPTLRQNQKAD